MLLISNTFLENNMKYTTKAIKQFQVIPFLGIYALKYPIRNKKMEALTCSFGIIHINQKVEQIQNDQITEES